MKMYKYEIQLTTGRCNPPLTRKNYCDEICNKNGILKMYDYHGKTKKLKAYTYIKEWIKVVIIDNEKGITTTIKEI